MVRLHIGGRSYRVGTKAVRRLLGLIMVLLGISLASAGWQAYSAHQTLRLLQAQVAAQRRQNTALQAAVKTALSAEVVASRARETMGLVRPGETVYEVAVPVASDDPYRVPRR